MRVIASIALVVIVPMQLPTQANAAPSALVRACAAEIKRICRDVPLGFNRVAQCVKDQFPDLSQRCQSQIGRAAATIHACKKDLGELCPGVKPWASKACLNANGTNLSGNCRNSLAELVAGGR
jgi:hypothetical protein